MFHITNGDSANAYLKRIGVKGIFIAWQDVLHDGPLTDETNIQKISDHRSVFLAEYFCLSLQLVRKKFAHRDNLLSALDDENKVVLWLTPELFDSLIGLQFLAWYQAENHKRQNLSIVMLPDHLPPRELNRAQIMTYFQTRFTPEKQFFDLVNRVWLAVTHSNLMLEQTLQDDFKYWPNLKATMQRYLEEKPLNGGLSRTQWQILEALDNNRLSLAQLFGANQNQEEFPFMGDLSFWSILEQMRDLIDIDTQACILHQEREFYHRHYCQLNDKGAGLL